MRLLIDTTTTQIYYYRRKRRTHMCSSSNRHLKVVFFLSKGICIGDDPVIVSNSSMGAVLHLKGFASSTTISWPGVSRCICGPRACTFYLNNVRSAVPFQSESGQRDRESTAYIREESEGRSTLIFQTSSLTARSDGHVPLSGSRLGTESLVLMPCGDALVLLL